MWKFIEPESKCAELAVENCSKPQRWWVVWRWIERYEIGIQVSGEIVELSSICTRARSHLPPAQCFSRACPQASL